MNAKKKKNSPAKDARRRVASQLNSQYVTLPIDEVLDDENKRERTFRRANRHVARQRQEFQQVEDVLITADRRLVGGHCLKLRAEGRRLQDHLLQDHNARRRAPLGLQSRHQPARPSLAFRPRPLAPDSPRNLSGDGH
jgi:hypothetical protein